MTIYTHTCMYRSISIDLYLYLSTYTTYRHTHRGLYHDICVGLPIWWRPWRMNCATLSPSTACGSARRL